MGIRTSRLINSLCLYGLFLIIGCASCPSSGQLVCTMDVKMCPDGSYVARNPDMGCEFNACPPLRDCAAGNPCPNGEDCYDFQNDEREAYCFRGDPCLICPSGQCDVLESFPPQVVCR